ncbi:MAG: cbb3-type cytochrome oxidase assembly protein CcoS [Thermonemataceae bacterium]|nr:cbb3-type cytochrome oxidase assembly protein CcoS [Thermonemataceae bacterium]
MSVIYALLIISSIIASVFLIVFLWNLRSGQYEDSYTPSVRILFDDSIQESKDKKIHQKS